MITIFDENPEIIKIVDQFLDLNPQYKSLVNTNCITLQEIINKQICDSLIIEGNSFGVMSSGLAYELSQIDSNIENNIQKEISSPLSIGESIEVDLKNIQIYYAVTSFLPTMPPPGTELPLSATLGVIGMYSLMLQQHADYSIYMPLFCVHSGKVPVLSSIAQICFGIKLISEKLPENRTHEYLIEVYNQFQAHNFNLNQDA